MTNTSAVKTLHVMTAGEELLHALTHGLGAVLAALGTAYLWRHLPEPTTPLHELACGIYGASLVILFTTSTVFHAVPARFARSKRLLQRCDHAAIYLLIAGTYTPFTLLAFNGRVGTGMFIGVWALALFGLVVTARSLLGTPSDKREAAYARHSLVLYLVMGWLCVLAIPDGMRALPATSWVLLAAGGLAYTGGVAFFLAEKKWMHTVWHAFVLAGGALHFAAVFLLL